MSENDENETQGVVFGLLAGIILGVIALVAGVAVWSTSQTAAPKAAPQALVAESDIAPVGDALAKVYFGVGQAHLDAADAPAIAKAAAALAAKTGGIVLLSGFHDLSGDAHKNAELAKQRALAVRDALVAAGVAAERVKLRKPESTVGTGSTEESRRVEIRVQ